MKEFDARVAKCSPRMQRLLDFLRTVAEHAGPDVESPTFDGSDGTGITYRRNGKRFLSIRSQARGRSHLGARSRCGPS
jgi:hypothetical protein